jgi:hypothetical protein
VKPGKTRVSLAVAVEKIVKSGAFDPALLAKLSELLGLGITEKK